MHSCSLRLYLLHTKPSFIFLPRARSSIFENRMERNCTFYNLQRWIVWLLSTVAIHVRRNSYLMRIFLSVRYHSHANILRVIFVCCHRHRANWLSFPQTKIEIFHKVFVYVWFGNEISDHPPFCVVYMDSNERSFCETKRARAWHVALVVGLMRGPRGRSSFAREQCIFFATTT